MSRFDWLSELIALCEDEDILMRGGSTTDLSPAHTLALDVGDWGRFAEVAHDQSLRWCAIWALQQDEETLLLNACFEKGGDYLVARTILEMSSPVLPSHTPVYPAANRPERHMQDMYGVLFSNHPDHRRWARHQAWSEDEYPLRKDFATKKTAAESSQPTQGSSDKTANVAPADSDYAFFQATGAAVYEIPVGPIHAGIIEPGHFRFQAVGEHILNLEERLGYTHKGIEKIAEGRDPLALAKLAGRVSGDTTVSHTWAACVAMERAAKVKVPQRACYIRALLAERERVANHIGDIGAVCNDVGFAFAHIQFSRLREIWQRSQMEIFNHRLLMDTVLPGGVNVDVTPDQIETLKKQHQWLRQELEELMEILDANLSLEDRLVSTGVLSPEMAVKLGVVGYVAKASGQEYDLRRDHAYAPYEHFKLKSICYKYGDVASRVRVRAEEAVQSLTLMDELLQQLPAGELVCEWKKPAADAEGLGLIEGWRGEIISYVRFDDNGNIARFYVRDPSWLNWPAIEQLIHGNIVPDFPVCNKSVNASYSGHDL